jgi:hypothetical protein
MQITEEKLIYLYNAIDDQPYIKITFLLKDLDLHTSTVKAMKNLNYIGFEDGRHYWVDEMIPIDKLMVLNIEKEIKNLNKRKTKIKR